MMIPEWLGAWVNPPTRYHGWWFPHSTFASEDFVGKIPILTASVSSLCFIHQTQCQGSPQVRNPTAFPVYKRGDAGSSHKCGERSGVGEGAYLEQGTTLHLKLDMAWHLEKCKAPWKRCTISKNIEKELMQRIVQREIAKGNATWKREASWQRPRLIWLEMQEAKRCVLVCNFWFWAGKGLVFRFLPSYL